MKEEDNKRAFIKDFKEGQSPIEQVADISPSEKSVFELDGTDFRPNREASKLIVKNAAINSFITARKHTPNCILVGPKGSGKSLLLRLHSWSNSMEKDSPLNISDSNDFSIKFDFSEGLSKKDLYEYVRDDDYRLVWEFSIKYFILRALLDKGIHHPIYGLNALEIPGADILQKVAPKQEVKYLTTIGDILSILLKNRSMIGEVSSCLIALNGALRILEKNLDRPLTMYVDNVDQAFLEKLVEGGGVSTDISMLEWVDNRKKRPIVKIWLNANIAFLRAVWNINKSFSFISLFATVRYEAWNHFLNSNLAKNIPQIESNIILLKYDKWELNHLIENFISVQNNALKKALSNLVEKERTHPLAKNSQINQEKFSDFMIRHTFGNPRDLIYLLNELSQEMIKISKSGIEVKIEHYGALIDRVSNEKVFENFAKECLPAFPYQELDLLLKTHQTNYFKREDLDEESMILIQELFRYGLIGVVDENESIFFERGANYPEEKITLPDSPYYFTHPCLDYKLSKISKGGSFYYPYCVIGNGLKYKSMNELTYYLPKRLPNKYRKDIEEMYERFYDGEFSTDLFNKIPIRIKTKYNTLFLNNLMGSNHAISNSIKASIDRGVGSCMKKEEDIRILVRNIKLRIIIALAVLFKRYTHGREVIELFAQEKTEGYLIATITFTHDCFTNNRKINPRNVFESLSHFEAEIIYEFLCNPEMDRFLKGEDHLQQDKQAIIEKARADFASFFPHFTWS